MTMIEQQRNENSATVLETKEVDHAELADAALETVSGGIIIIGGRQPLAYTTVSVLPSYSALPAAY
jgi:hypothetical protein